MLCTPSSPGSATRSRAPSDSSCWISWARARRPLNSSPSRPRPRSRIRALTCARSGKRGSSIPGATARTSGTALLTRRVAAFLLALQALGRHRYAEVREVAESYLERRDTLEPIPPEELRRRLNAGDVTLIDVRPGDEFAAGHIPGALSVPGGRAGGPPPRASQTQGDRGLLPRPVLRHGGHGGRAPAPARVPCPPAHREHPRVARPRLRRRP